MYQADIMLFDNFGGLSAAVGIPMSKNISFFIGSSYTVNFDPIIVDAPIQGVSVTTLTRNGKGVSIFTDLYYKNFFIRYMQYDAVYDYTGQRLNLTGTGLLLDTGVVKEKDSLVLVGFIFPLQ